MKRFPLRSLVLLLAAVAGLVGAALPTLTRSEDSADATRPTIDRAAAHAQYEPAPQQLNIALLLATAPR